LGLKWRLGKRGKYGGCIEWWKRRIRLKQGAKQNKKKKKTRKQKKEH